MVQALIQSEWHGEDAQHLDSMPADILDEKPKKSKKVPDVPDVPLKLPEELLDFDWRRRRHTGAARYRDHSLEPMFCYCS